MLIEQINRPVQISAFAGKKRPTIIKVLQSGKIRRRKDSCIEWSGREDRQPKTAGQSACFLKHPGQ
jgi:hypothetical protein